MDRDRLIRELNLKSFGQQGWLASEDLTCPACGKSGKVGISVNKNGGTIHCFKCSNSESLYKYLKSIGRTDLIENKIQFSLYGKFVNLYEEIIEEETPLKEVKLPVGAKRIQRSEYLDNRRFLPLHYELFEPMVTTHFLEKRLHDTIIFSIYQKNVRVGWQCRSILSKEWHKQNLTEVKQGKSQLKLRWQNITGVDFTRILGGYDEITENTHTVILVEGLFDKVGCDFLIDLHRNEDIKSCFTFGNKISHAQISLLRETNVENIILMYDFGTTKIVKGLAMTLQKYFNVLVADIDNPDVDPGDMSHEYMKKLLNNLKSSINFYIGKL